MSGTDHYEFFDAMVDYKAGKYAIALQKWESVMDVGPDTLSYYRGMALIGLGEDNEALQQLGEIVSTSPLHVKSQWYSIYLLIRMERYDEALALLPSLPDSLHGYERVLEFLNSKQ